MKPVDIESPKGLDRLATWNEVRRATSFSFQGAFRPVGACNDFQEMVSDASGRARNLPEDAEWLAIIIGMTDFTCN
jgi:hypothetical protein